MTTKKKPEPTSENAYEPLPCPCCGCDEIEVGPESCSSVSVRCVGCHLKMVQEFSDDDMDYPSWLQPSRRGNRSKRLLMARSRYEQLKAIWRWNHRASLKGDPRLAELRQMVSDRLATYKKSSKKARKDGEDVKEAMRSMAVVILENVLAAVDHTVLRERHPKLPCQQSR